MIRSKNRSTRLRARYKCFERQIGSRRLDFRGMFAQAPRPWRLPAGRSHQSPCRQGAWHPPGYLRSGWTPLRCRSSAWLCGRVLPDGLWRRRARRFWSRARLGNDPHIDLDPPFCHGPVLVDPNNGRIDHLHLAIVSRGDDIHQPVPNAGLPPPLETVVYRRRWAEALRKI